MKNKTTKILAIVSIIIVVIGTLLSFTTNLTVPEDNAILSLFGLYMSTIIKLFIIAFSLGIVCLIWIVYGIIKASKNIKKGENKKTNIFYIIGLIFLALLLMTPVIKIYINRSDTKTRYDYNMKYFSGSNTYDIYKTKNKVEVYTETMTECVKDPCPTVKTKTKINFSKKNMKKVNNFFDDYFKKIEYNSVIINTDYLNEYQIGIINSLIYNDESLIDNTHIINDYYYEITTDYRFITSQNDGGSHINIYYKVYLDDFYVEKYQDKYVGLKGYEYQGKQIYRKKISPSLAIEMNELLEDLLKKEDVNDTKNYSPFVIKKYNKEKSIYNEQSIKSLRDMIGKIDNSK